MEALQDVTDVVFFFRSCINSGSSIQNNCSFLTSIQVDHKACRYTDLIVISYYTLGHAKNQTSVYQLHTKEQQRCKQCLIWLEEMERKH